MSKKISIFLIFFLTVFVFLLFNFWKSMAVSYLWSLKTVDSVGNVGWYTSISAVDANTIFISYYDMTNGTSNLPNQKMVDKIGHLRP